MHPRIRLALAVLALVVVALAAAVLLGSGHRSGARTASAGLEGGQIDIPAANFSLVDQSGRRASLAEYRGQVVILTFMYSTCQNTCPVEAQQIRGALDDLGQSIPTLAVSVDPAQDTPINAQRFLFKESLTGRMRFLLGTRAQLAPIWKAYGIAPETGTNLKNSNHSAYVLLDRQARPAPRRLPRLRAHPRSPRPRHPVPPGRIVIGDGEQRERERSEREPSHPQAHRAKCRSAATPSKRTVFGAGTAVSAPLFWGAENAGTAPPTGTPRRRADNLPPR